MMTLMKPKTFIEFSFVQHPSSTRELTQLQSILQNQIEKHGRHFFKEGTVVIPGAIGFTEEYYAVKIQSTLAGTDISAQIQDYVGKRIRCNIRR